MNRCTKAFTKTLLATSISSCLALPALAQVGEGETPEGLEEIVVTGIRGSLQSSLSIKRNASAVVDSITAEDIGKFPDQNVAESLARIPGVAIDRDFGEGQGVTIRGVAPDQNITLMNGQAVGTSQWFVLQNATRNFNFEILASEMVAGIDVYKSAQANIDEGGLGGTVNLRTRRPLDFDANTFHLGVDGQYSGEPDEWDPTVAGMYSWKTQDETFGVLLSLAYQERTVERSAIETFGFFGPGVARIEPSLEGPKLPDGSNDDKGSLPWGVGSALFQQDRERLGIDFNTQWRPTDELELGFHYLSSEMDADNVNSNLIGIPFRGVAFLGEDTNTGSTNEDGIVEELNLTGLPNRPAWARHMAFDNIFREGSDMDTEVIDFEVNFDRDRHHIHLQFGETTGEGTNNDFFTEFWVDATDPRAAFDFTNPNGQDPRIDFVGPSPWLQNPGDEFWFGGFFDQTNETEDKEQYIQLDYDLDVELGPVHQLSFGYKFRDREFEQIRTRNELTNLAPIGEGSLGPASDFLDGDMITGGLGQSVFMPDLGLMTDAVNARPMCSDAGVDAETELCQTGVLLDGIASFEVDEIIRAWYAMASFEEENFRGNVGIRYVDTDQSSNGFNDDGTAQDRLSGDYDEILPSLNVAYDLRDDLILRFAAGRALTRPAPFQLAPAFNLTPETGTGSAGNPNLDPLVADQFELGLEWYYGEGNNISFTTFKKEIKDFIFNTTVSAVVDGFDIPQLTRPENGGSTSLDGFEFQVTHTFDSGFGFQGNYTFVDDDPAVVPQPVATEGGGATLVDNVVQFPNVSEDTFNLSGFFENDLFSVRLTYSYRDEYFLGDTEFGSSFRDTQENLDASFTYHLTDQIELTADAINLTDETIENFERRASDGKEFTASRWENGRRFVIGASYRF